MLGLALAAILWWLYFDGEDERAERALERAPQEQRPRLAVNAFGYIFLPILGGIVVVAAGMKLAVLRYNEPATVATALFLALGVGVYVLGLVLFRWLLHSGPLGVRLAIVILALPTALIGLAADPLAQLIVLVTILIAGTIADTLVTNRRFAAC
jgi:low temperature requirement protein LtrA